MIRINHKSVMLNASMHLLNHDNIFEHARKYFESKEGEKQRSISVLDKDNEYLFSLENYPDVLYDVSQKGTIYTTVQLYDEDNIDYMLFEDVEIAVYYELEEYTYTICQMIQRKFPSIVHIFLDKSADLLLENVTVCEDLATAKPYINGKVCIYITSEGRNATGAGLQRDYISRIYNSINVMRSLSWVQKHVSYGKKNKNKTIFLIDTSTDDVGLVDIIKLVCYYKNIALEHGWIPVVKLDCFPNQYLREDGENMWEYFFEPISEISVSEAMESSDVISMRENGQLFHQIEVNPFVRKYSQIMMDNSFLRNNFSLNEDVYSYIVRHMPTQCTDDSLRVLGVIMRGTDYRRSAVLTRGEIDINAIPEDVINRVHELDKIRGYDYIFVATEDAEYFNIFKQEFGKRMLYLEQKRVWYNDLLAEKAVSELLEVSGDINFVKQYLTVIYTLSKCNGLLVSRNCGASRLARSWNKNQYEVDEVVGRR